MVAYENNVYYNPEALGLEMVGDVEWVGASYEFDMTGVWKEKRGVYWIGDDSGCSCPCPFEDTTKDDLAGPYNKAQLKERLENLVDERAGDGGYYSRSRADLMKDVREILSRLT